MQHSVRCRQPPLLSSAAGPLPFKLPSLPRHLPVSDMDLAYLGISQFAASRRDQPGDQPEGRAGRVGGGGFPRSHKGAAQFRSEQWAVNSA